MRSVKRLVVGATIAAAILASAAPVSAAGPARFSERPLSVTDSTQGQGPDCWEWKKCTGEGQSSYADCYWESQTYVNDGYKVSTCDYNPNKQLWFFLWWRP
jgi:hypothetical protein